MWKLIFHPAPTDKPEWVFSPLTFSCSLSGVVWIVPGKVQSDAIAASLSLISIKKVDCLQFVTELKNESEMMKIYLFLI